MLNAVSNKVDFVGMEREILSFWARHRTFERSLEQRRGAREYVFYDGPPFATGLPHYGHLLAGTIKDIVPRYQTMRGHYVERRFGWDCHGLPIEALAQEHLGLSGTAAIREKGIDVFNETCRSLVLKYVEEWRRTVTRMGRWVDFDRDYKTMDVSFMESIWWVFKQLWDKGRVYKSYRIMPYSWKLTTPLSNFEAGSNYQDVQDPAITVRLRLTSGPPALPAGGSVEPWYALIWTTTPWTLPANLAVCVGPDIDYVAVREGTEAAVHVLAEARVSAYYKDPKAVEIVARFKGRDLKDWTYQPLFPYLAQQAGAFRVLVDGYVTTEDGTGIVHIAPAYGEDDFRIGQGAGLPPVDLLDENACFTARAPDFAGQFCKDADKPIIRRLKEAGSLVHHTTLVHSYPFCERTETPLIYRAIEAWYVKVEDLRDRLVEHNRGVHWMPGAIGEKRFGNWLRDAKDWNISRNRFWGSCLPIWVAEDGDAICVGSIQELEELSGVRVTDLHKHVLDKVTITRNGKSYKRTPEVLDCWFESGAMPYAQMHYPFENKARFEASFPADFIAEGLDQTRGWFYTLLVLSTSLFDKAAFRNVVVNGLVLAEDGRKMSKRLKNYPDPALVLETHGADALRLYMINSPVVRADDLRFSEEGVKQCLRDFLIPWWNAYAFFVTYARIDGWTPQRYAESSSVSKAPATPRLIDRWILSALERLNQQVVEAMDDYDLQSAVRPFVQFIDDLTKWYIRRSRRRFWKSQDDADKQQAYATLYEVLLRLCRIAAPFTPFIAEAIHQNLRTEDLPESVHLCDFPLADPRRRDLALEAQMEEAVRVVELGRQVRTQYDLKVRQPLRRLVVVCHDRKRLDLIAALRDGIAEELNVREVVFSEHESDLADLAAKADFKKLGPRLGPRMKLAADAIRQLTAAQVERLLGGESVEIQLAGEPVLIGREDVIVERKAKPGMAVAATGDLVAALDTELDDELRLEGLARELVNKIQNLRKKAGLDLAQRIEVRIQADAPVRAALEAHREYIGAEVLARKIELQEELAEGEDLDLNGQSCRVGFVALTGLVP